MTKSNNPTMRSKLNFIIFISSDWEKTLINKIIKKLDAFSKSFIVASVYLAHNDQEILKIILSDIQTKSRAIRFIGYTDIDFNSQSFIDFEGSSIIVTQLDYFLQLENSVDACFQAVGNPKADIEYINHNFLTHPESYEKIDYGNNFSSYSTTRFLLNDDITDGFSLVLSKVKSLPDGFPPPGDTYFFENLYSWLLNFSTNNALHLIAGHRASSQKVLPEKEGKTRYKKILMQDLLVRKFLETHSVTQAYPEMSLFSDKISAMRDAHFDFGASMMKRESPLYDQALLNFQEVLLINSTDSMAANNIGCCYFYLRKPSTAMSYMEAASANLKNIHIINNNKLLIKEFIQNGTMAESLVCFESSGSSSAFFRNIRDFAFLESNFHSGKPLINEINSSFQFSRDRSKFQGDPLISVILPTYNRPEYLEQSLCSLSRQDFSNFEVVLVNDSGCSVADKVDKYSATLNIKYIEHTENKGLAASRNTGLNHAKGKYISYLDDDDIYFSNHLRLLTDILENSDFKIAYSDSLYSVCENHKLGMLVKDQSIPHSESFNKAILLVANITPVINVVHEKACIDNAGIFDIELKMFEDWDLWIRMSQFYDFIHFPFVTADYRVRDDKSNMTSLISQNNLQISQSYIYDKYRHLIEAKLDEYMGGLPAI